MRFLYSALWWLVSPLALFKIWRRGANEPGYRRHVLERLGVYRQLADRDRPPLIWVHAVSVGETRAAQPLIDALMAAYPDHSLLLTHMSVTGRATGQQLYADYGSRFVQSYMPYDLGFMAARFLRYFKPRICLLMETEVWPNMVAQCVRLNVPVALVNARLSEKSLRRGQRFGGLMRQAAAGLSLVAAQTEADGERLKRFGARNVHITGSFKFDVAPPPAVVVRGGLWREQIGERPVLLCASTRDGEEALILSAFEKFDKAIWGNALLVLVPRHPQRFDKVAALIDANPGLSMRRRSAMRDDTEVPPSTSVLLGDTMGEMFAYYALCDIAFIGGSLLPLGGQNLIEAAMLGKPVLTGPHTFNFAQITEDAIAIGCALQVPDADAMLLTASNLFQDLARRQAMQQAALQFSGNFRGATDHVMPLLSPLLIHGDNVYGEDGIGLKKSSWHS